MLPITLEDITHAVSQGFQAGLSASDDILHTVHTGEEDDVKFLLRKSRDATSKVVEELSRRLEYIRDSEVDTMYWTARNNEVVYWDALWSEADAPPAEISKWHVGAVQPTKGRIAIWADLLGINGVRD